MEPKMESIATITRRAKKTEYMRGWCARNRDKVNATARATYQRRKEKANAYGKAYYRKNKESLTEAIRKWKENNIEKMRKYFIEYAEKNKKRLNEYRKQYYVINRDRKKALDRAGRAMRRKAIGNHGLAHERELISVQKGICYYCGNTLGEKPHLEHMIPLSIGGSDNPSNLCFACAKCNCSKRSKTAGQFIAFKGFAVNLAQKAVDALHGEWLVQENICTE